MDEKKELSLDESVVKALEIFEARQAAKEAQRQAEEEALQNAAKAQKYDELMAEIEKKETWAESKKSVSIKRETKAGFKDEDMVVFDKYLRGQVDLNVARKALATTEVSYDENGEMKVQSEGTATAGGVLVPSDWNAGLIELRDQGSFPRRMGVQQIMTSYDNIDIPAEATAYTKFTRAAESGAYTTNDAVLAQNNVIPQKWTKLTKVTEELLADDVYDLLGYLQRGYGRAMAQTENYYVALGSGTNQHLGIFEGGDTNALTFDSGANITPDEIWELFYTLGAGYRGQAAWLMASSVWRYILSIRDANNWAFSSADMATIGAGAGQPDGQLFGKPVFLQDDLPAISSGTAVIAVGDPYYYALVDRSGLSIARLDELYKANGQVGFAANFRQSGTVLYELAWVLGAMA